jgi:histidine triad (HIT) family protein
MNDCIFCKIINKEIPADIVYEDDDLIAFKDINPKAPVHILIVPKKHIPTFNDITEDDFPIYNKIIKTVQKIAKDFNVADSGYRVLVNVNEEGGQVIYHLHVHLIGGKLFRFEQKGE